MNAMSVQQALTNVTSFAELLPLARGASTHLSCWGSRYVSVAGYTDTLELDALPAKVIELIKKHPNFDEQERGYGKEIASLIDRNIYDAIDMQADNTNCITWLFVKLRDICNVIFLVFKDGPLKAFWPHGTRWEWRDDKLHYPSTYQNAFDLYTEEQFKSKHGLSVEEAKKIGYSVPAMCASRFFCGNTSVYLYRIEKIPGVGVVA
jgi:hypothetical protein